MTQHKKHRTLTELLRDEFHPRIFFEWHLMVLEGKNPKIVRDTRCTLTSGMRVVEDELDRDPPSKADRARSLQALENRRDGLPAQTQILEGMLRTTSTHTVVGIGAVSNLDPATLAAVVGTLRGVLTPPPPAAGALPADTSSQDHLGSDAIDAESSAIAEESSITEP